MRHTTRIAILFAACLVSLLGSRPLSAQACKDDEEIAKEEKKNVADIVETVKKESLADFQKSYHHRSCQNKLTFCSGAMNRLLTCLDKAVQDTTADPEDISAYKAKRATYGKLKDKIEEDRKALSGANNDKDAKVVIEKFNYSN